MTNEKYMRSAEYSTDQYFCADAITSKEKMALIEDGFEYVIMDPHGRMYFRKPK